MQSFLKIILLFFITIFFLFLCDHYDFQFVSHDISAKNGNTHIESVHAATLIILTFILACIAWIQLSGLKRAEQAEFLFKIDQRFGEQSIIKARIIIHELYLQSKGEHPNFTELQHREQIGEFINQMSSEVHKKEEYIYLLNFLDYLESLSLLTNKDYISQTEVNDLMNQSLDFFYKIFTPRIQARRKKYNDDTFYIEFEKLIKKIEDKKNCCSLCKCLLKCIKK